MASTDALPIPRKNVAYRVTFPILDADGDLVTGAGSLDTEISKDGGTFADCTNEATEIATSSGMYYLDLTSTEMNADTVALIVKSSGGKTTPIVLYPAEDAELRANVVAWLGTAPATPGTAGVPSVDAIRISTSDTAANNLETAALNYSATRGLTGTALPAAAADAAGGIPISDAGGLDLDALNTAAVRLTATRAQAIDDWINGGRLDLILDIIAADTTTDIPALIAALNNLSSAQAQTAATAALNAYDPPTKAELDTAIDALPTAAENADAVWDEDATGHLSAGSTGEKLNAAGGAGGAGAISWEVRIRDSSLNPVEGASVWVSTDAGGTNVIAGTLVTTGMGIVTFLLDAGTYYLWAQKDGRVSIQGQSFTVS